MKKFAYIALTMMLVFAACTKVENTSAPVSIRYAVGCYAATTKAYVAVTEDGITSFSSKAFLHANGDASTQYFFGTDGETITYYSATGEWLPSHDYYWPKHTDSYINFVSWYANDGSADITPDTVTETAFEINDRTVGANDRILVADEAWLQKANSTTYYTSGVPTLFRHVLSRVKVNLKATTLTDPEIANVTYEITLQSAELEGIFQQGSMKLVNTPLTDAGTRQWYSTESSTYLWKTASGSDANVTMVDTDTAIGTDYTAILPERSFIPQTLGDDIKMTLTYTVSTYSNGSPTSSETDIPATITMNTIKNTSGVAITQWFPNKIYTYNIAINPVGGEILLNPTVETEWTFEEDINVTVE